MDTNNGPRVTPADIEANIIDTEIVKHVSKSGQVLRWAVLTTRNGFAVTGRPSAAVSPENDNAERGEKTAIDNAKMELWPLMGYALKERLAGSGASTSRDFLHGDVVRLKSGGPDMVVAFIDCGSVAQCTWRDAYGQAQAIMIHIDSLELVRVAK